MKNKDLHVDTSENGVNSRREFLKKAGRFAAYTPPAMMLLVKPSHATIRKSGIGDGGYVKPQFHRPRHWWGKISWWGRFWH